MSHDYKCHKIIDFMAFFAYWEMAVMVVERMSAHFFFSFLPFKKFFPSYTEKKYLFHQLLLNPSINLVTTGNH